MFLCKGKISREPLSTTHKSHLKGSNSTLGVLSCTYQFLATAPQNTNRTLAHSPFPASSHGAMHPSGEPHPHTVALAERAQQPSDFLVGPELTHKG